MNKLQRPAILVVEDDEEVRQTVLDFLDFNDFECFATDNGRDALALAKVHHPTLIITDLEMPHMNGFELLKELRSHEVLRTIPVIVITANSDRPAGRRAMDLGADDCITKPFTGEELIYSVRTRLVKKDLLDELDAFAHSVAHDLRNPLASLMGRLALIQHAVGLRDETMVQRNLTEATRAATRIDSIIDELLLLAGVRRLHVEARVLDMGAVAKEATQRLEDFLRRSGATVEVPAQWPAALGHADWIVHVWTNYIDNAAKYGGPNARISLGSTAFPERGVVRFWVQDRGAGLEPAAQAALFVPFSRISSVRAQGHGLGLSIVRRIVEKLQGTVGVESTPGQGAQFWFELPMGRGPAEP